MSISMIEKIRPSARFVAGDSPFWTDAVCPARPCISTLFVSLSSYLGVDFADVRASWAV